MAREAASKPADPIKPATVVPLFRRRPVGEGEPEARIGLASVNGVSASDGAGTPSSLDLSGKPKVWFIIGAGNSGKTVEVRWMVNRMAEQGREAILAALDPANRSWPPGSTASSSRPTATAPRRRAGFASS